MTNESSIATYIMSKANARLLTGNIFALAFISLNAACGGPEIFTVDSIPSKSETGAIADTIEKNRKNCPARQ